MHLNVFHSRYCVKRYLRISILSFSSSSAHKTCFLTLPPDPQAYANLLTECSKKSLLSAHHPFDKIPHSALPSETCRVLHARILQLGFRLSGTLASTLLDLYAKTHDLDSALDVFNRLDERSPRTWSSILWAHSKVGSPESVLDAFRSMRQADATSPDQFSFAIVLSALAKLSDLDLGRVMHCMILKSGFGSSSFCEGSLIDMYTKCGSITDAGLVFDGIDCPDTVSWTTMIAGYVRIGECDEALRLFSRMRDSGAVPDQVTLVTVMTACVNMGRFDYARDLLRKIHLPNVVAWNAIISGHAQNGLEKEAIEFYREMREKDVKPTRSTLGSVLSATASLMALDEGRRVHSEAIRLGLDSNVFVGSSLISMYAKCCLEEEARMVFDTSVEKNVVMWNAVMGGLLQSGRPEEVLRMFVEMKCHGIVLDEFTFVSALGACASLEDLGLGRQIHGITVKRNLEESLYVRNAIVDMYAKSRELYDARLQFELTPSKDIVSWNAMVVGYAHIGSEEEALRLFQRMRLEGTEPDEVSFTGVISTCSNLQAFTEGAKVHCLAIKYDFGSDLYVGSSLIDMYAKLGELENAKKVFLKMPIKSVVAWNVLISGHVHNNKEHEAYDLFKQMLFEGIKPSPVTLSGILAACNGPMRLKIGFQLQCYALKSGILYGNAFLEVSLLGMYLKSRSLEDASNLFLELPESKSLVLWTAMISGHSQNGYSEEALSLFWDMRSHSVRLDEAIFASVLKACADLASLRDGRKVHSLIILTGFSSYEYGSSALIDMYSKCGDVNASLQVFEELENKEVIVSWNSMILGFAKNGCENQAVVLFNQMEQSLMKPDEVTFLGVLSACSHAGLVSEGRHFFDLMAKKYGIIPRADHYACMIDILGRGGYLKEAEEFIYGLPVEPDATIWAALLAACRVHGDEIRGKRVAEKLICLEPHNSSPYVLLSNICAASGDWAGARTVRLMMREKGVKKSPGCSWIEVGNKTSLFIAGDSFHPNSSDVYEMLEDLTVAMSEDDLVAEAAELDLLLLGKNEVDS